MSGVALRSRLWLLSGSTADIPTARKVSTASSFPQQSIRKILSLRSAVVYPKSSSAPQIQDLKFETVWPQSFGHLSSFHNDL